MSSRSRSPPDNNLGITNLNPYVTSDEESLNKEIIEQLNGSEKSIYEAAYKLEKDSHPFAKYYLNPEIEFDFAKNISAIFDNYTHEKAIKFIAKTHVWNERSVTHEELPVAPHRVKAIHQFLFVDNIHAMYRLISIKEDKYILMACHFNVHGFNRGDLRFVEVNNRTKTNASEYSCIGHLGHGDILAVTELSRICPEKAELNVDVFQVTQETPCIWMVKNMTVLKRFEEFDNCPFSFLNNGTAIALRWKQVLTVQYNHSHHQNKDIILIGSGFIPFQTKKVFASGFDSKYSAQLDGMTSGITRYPISTGTIFTYHYDHELTEQIAIGHNAFSLFRDYTRNMITIRTSEQITQFCALMGLTAVIAVSAGNFDCRSFKMIDPNRQGELIHFFIENVQSPKPENLWKVNTRISIGSSKNDANATIETVMTLGEKLKICARLSNESLDFEFTDPIHMVSQKEISEGSSINENFMEELEYGTNGRMIIEALYGGRRIVAPPLWNHKEYEFPGLPPTPLNFFQSEYVNRILGGSPITFADSPFGSGKSMTIATAAYYAVLRSRHLTDGCQHLLVTQSNFASVNLVDITEKYARECVVIRFILEDNWIELPEEGRTDMDLPIRMQQIFRLYVMGNLSCSPEYLFQMAIYLKEKNLIETEEMIPVCREYFILNPNAKKYDFVNLTKIFFEVHKPEIVITTVDSLRNAIPFLSRISTVQFDEGSQIPESSLIQIIPKFPRACFGFVGDIRQLPPYCDVLLPDHLRRFGIGNVMERSVVNQLFPQVALRYVYRCHPLTTQLLGFHFYNGRLLPGVKKKDRNQFMTKRPDFWPNPNFPLMIINNPSASCLSGTSFFNQKEIEIVRHIVYNLTSSTFDFRFDPSEIGIISFYKAQTTYLLDAFRDINIKCGTVDSFQGTEKEVIILCCTNETISGFLGMKNRINVALSRAKQTTIIVGNVNGLERAEFWSSIVNIAHAHGCIPNFD